MIACEPLAVVLGHSQHLPESSDWLCSSDTWQARPRVTDRFCRSLGCVDPQCALCEHNPHRRCTVNFAPKYLVNDILKAKCEASIRVDIIDRATAAPVGDEARDIHLEVGCCTSGRQ